MIKIMKNLLYLLVLYLFFSVNVSAEIIKQFLISGNDRISDQTIILFTERELNQDIKEKDLNYYWIFCRLMMICVYSKDSILLMNYLQFQIPIIKIKPF